MRLNTVFLKLLLFLTAASQATIEIRLTKFASEFEKAKLKQNADHEKALLKVDEASKKASNNVSSATDQLERLVQKTETKIFQRIEALKESANKIDVSVECLEAKQNKCESLVSANRGVLNKMSDDDMMISK